MLVPEGEAWVHGGEPVGRVFTGWATAMAVGAPGPYSPCGGTAITAAASSMS
ncbi:hypothetical protein [Streptomyces phaeochromogenes]|uniref:hypothetical protein n=1 Tax=Streptomyces phaeochromogenes TaxID=1923 RepID=UPI003F4D3D2D